MNRLIWEEEKQNNKEKYLRSLREKEFDCQKEKEYQLEETDLDI